MRHLFSFPVFSEEERRHRAEMLRWTIWSMLLVVDTQTILALFLLPQNRVRLLAVILTYNLTLPFLLLLNRRGYMRLAGALLMMVIWLLSTGQAVTWGGIHAPVVFFYLLNVLTAGLVFGGAGGVLAAIVFALTASGLVLLERAGHLPGGSAPPTTFSIWVGLVICLELVAIFQFLANRTIKIALNQTGEAQAALRHANEGLEMRVQERTAELREVNARLEGTNGELQHVNTELQGINAELEAFSYSVSHDLRRPLRAVTGFTNLLMADHAGELSGDAQNLLTLTKDSTTRMNELIEALLKLSHVDRQALVLRPVNLSALVYQSARESQVEHPDRNIDLRVADLPQCVGDPALLRQVFANLLSNAIKYTRNRRVTVIEVGFKSEHEKRETVYFVRDNGVGFDMSHADRLFGVFQRLHSAQEFSGTGVGLSIVRRIIHRHGGRIWAEAAVDKGATFYFTLPAAHSEQAALEQNFVL